MTDAQFSTLTSIFSVGGLIGSAGANVVMDGRGRRGALRISAVLTALGAFLMTVAPGYAPLVIGRYFSPPPTPLPAPLSNRTYYQDC